MPPFSTVRTFVTALQSGQTNITRALDRLLTNPGRHRTNPNFASFRNRQAANAPLPPWLRGLLRGEGVSDPEVEHIDAWPDDQKEPVRDKTVEAILGDRRMRFFWELYDGPAPDTLIEDPDPTGGITVRFRSPRSRVRLSEDANEIWVEA